MEAPIVADCRAARRISLAAARSICRIRMGRSSGIVPYSRLRGVAGRLLLRLRRLAGGQHASRHRFVGIAGDWAGQDFV